MKKLLFLLLSAAVAVSASAGITRTSIDKKIVKTDRVTNKVEKVTRGCGFMPKPVAIDFKGSHVLRADGAATSWDFEDADQFAQFTLVDNDGDGFNWTYYNNDVADQNGDKHMTTHGGVGVIVSASYDNESNTALTPDNWLISPEVTLGGSLSFWAMGQDASYSAEKFGVYVCVGDPTDLNNFVQVGSDFTATGEFVQYEIDLSAYQGQVGYFAIVHHNITDMFFLNVDDIVLDASGVVLPYPVVPEVTVTPAATTADVEWVADENADGYNLRYRPWTDLSGNPHQWTFPLDSYADEAEGWWVYDADDDGQGWGFAYSSTAQDDVCLVSGSYTSSGACSPDNYIGTPDVPLKGELHFTMWGASASYPEVLQVYAMVGDDLYQLFEDSLVTTTTHTVYTVDLSAFDGAEGSIVFRNYSTYDQWSVYVDDIFIGDPNAEVVEPAEWTYVNELTDPNYTITGLTPETTYEVQVMGYNEAHESDWCDIVEFTTLTNTPDVYILGEVGEKTWDPTDGLKMEYNAEDNIYTATVTFDGRGQSGENYFSFTTELAENNDDGGWTYIAPFRFGAVSEGDFWYDDQYDGQPLDLTYENYQAFRIMAGKYKLTVDLANMKLIIEKQVPEVVIGDVNMDGKVNIADVTALIDYLLSNDASLISLPNSDINGDTNINIADVTTLIDMLLTN